MINRDALARFGKDQRQQPHTGSKEIGFDLDSYVALHGFEVTRRKTWESQPGGLLFELAECPFNKDHIGGSAAFTLVAGAPGFVCKHNGCHGKAIKDVFAMHPPAKLTPKSAPEGEEKRTQAQILCELAGDAKFFHTSEGGAYAQVRVGDHHETWALRSKEFRRWLVREFHKQCKKPPGAQGLQDAIGLLEARAQFDWPEAALFVRIGESGGALYIDLCNQNWEAVEIRAQGWRVVGDPPIRFRRSRGMLSLPYPVRGGSVALLRSLINIGDDNNCKRLINRLPFSVETVLWLESGLYRAR